MSSPTPVSKGASRIWKWIFWLILGGSVAVVAGAVGFYLHFSRDLPQIITVADYRPAIATQIFDRDGALLAEYAKERRYVVPYDKIPQVLVDAFVSAEDDKFFEHGGFNIPSIIRAMIANLKAGHVVQGGSTITQQVAKSLLLTPEKKLGRKAKELILASRIERNLSKQQILFLYLNQIYLGHGAYGVASAAKTYFRKDLSQITVAEAAILAGLPQAPSNYDPLKAPKKAKDRQAYVLRRMYENRRITAAEMKAAAAEAIRLYDDEDINGRIAPYLVEHIRRYLMDKYGSKALWEEGLQVTLPVRKEIVETARRSLREGLEVLDKRQGYRGPLQHFKTRSEAQLFLNDQFRGLAAQKFGYSLLTADGALNIDPAIQDEKLSVQSQLLETGKNYQAVVKRYDKQKKTLFVEVGKVQGEIPVEYLKWASGDKLPIAGDLIIVKVIQLSAESIVFSLEQEPQVQGALVSIEAMTGNLLALEGGYDFGSSEFNRATQAQRQPGSAFKPLIYSAGIEAGFTPASIIIDSPIVYGDGEEGKWKPTNYEEKFYGETTFRQALIKSRNIPTVKLVQAIQVPVLIEFSKRLGMNAQFPPDLSISLGSMGISLLELTRIYSVFPRLGRKVDPIFITRINDRDGRVLEEHLPHEIPNLPVVPPLTRAEPSPLVGEAGADGESPTPVPTPMSSRPATSVVFPSYPLAEDASQVLDPRLTYVMTHLMKEVVNYGTGYEAKQLGRPAAGKTGTTNDSVDGWFMGFTPFVVTGVWVGFDNQRSLGGSETGARAALPIWLSFMKRAVKDYSDKDFLVPPGVVFASIDTVTGKLSSANSSTSIREAFIEGTEPTEVSGRRPAKPQNQSDFFKEDTD